MGEAQDTLSQDEQVRRYCSQYLQLEPCPTLPAPEYLREASVQEAIFQNVFAEHAIRYGPPVRYQLRMLKQLVAQIEASIEDWDKHEVSENLMSMLGVLLSNPIPSEVDSAQQKSYVSYHQSYLDRAAASGSSSPRTKYVTMLENRSLLSAGGTTGLRTWEASLHLGQYLCENPSVVQGKRLLELGAGTGYLSIICAKYLGAEHIMATDGSDDVVNNMPDNFFLNDLQGSDCITATPLNFGWALVGTEEEKWNGGRPLDVVLGADITYDKSVIRPLVSTFEELFMLYPQTEIYISATQRNHDTFQAFLDECKKYGLVVEEVKFSNPANKTSQQGPYYSDRVEIKICKIIRSK
ncbi:lysine methyltransferase domain-containing protein [Sarocladium implicatum]|nr:lysine methyltransferase domain-containing protein [Sarocladium implicatum]